MFEEDAHLKSGLRFTQHKNGHLVTVCYAIEEGWSKSLRNRQDGVIWKKLVQAASDRMNGSPFGWIANKDVGADLFQDLNAEALPQVSHGLNSYQHLNNIVFLSARLPSPDHFGFLEWRGVGEKEVRRATYLDPVYQTVMRGSMRDPNNLDPKVVVVPDWSAAEYLYGLFAGSRIEKLKIDLDGLVTRKRRGRPKKHEDGTGRVQHMRAKRNAEINRLTALMSADPDTITNAEFRSFLNLVRQETCNENPIKEGFRDSVTQNLEQETCNENPIKEGFRGSVTQNLEQETYNENPIREGFRDSVTRNSLGTERVPYRTP